MALVLPQKITMKWNVSNKDWYIEKGYIFTKIRDEFLVDILDLKSNSNKYINYYCDYCGEKRTIKFQDYNAEKFSDKDACRNCRSKFQIKDTIKEKYGVENISHIEGIKEKRISTNIQKYGTENPMQNKSVFEKMMQTNMDKYGNKYAIASDGVRKKIFESFDRNGTCKTSSQQLKIFNLLLDHGFNVKINHPLSRCNLDIALFINNINIDIEYDGIYWHKDRKVEERRRDEFVKSNGWKVLRIKSKRIVPTIDELRLSIEELINSDRVFKEMILNDWT